LSDAKVDPSTGQFIDPLFAVIIAAALAETIVGWAVKNNWPDMFDLCVVLLGYINLLLSWFGYHKSVIRKPIRGSLRFIVTVILLPLYLLTIILYKNVAYIVIVYGLIFFMWTVWEYFKYIEYKDKKSFFSLQFRLFNYPVYLAVIFVFIQMYLPKSYQNFWLFDIFDSLVLILIAFSIMFLRLTKSASKKGSPFAKIKSEIHSLFFGVEETD
jgi:hypothetical protein